MIFDSSINICEQEVLFLETEKPENWSTNLFCNQETRVPVSNEWLCRFIKYLL